MAAAETTVRSMKLHGPSLFPSSLKTELESFSTNRENGVVGEQYKRRAAKRSGGVLHPRWRESSSRKHH
ncbi:hypothetical protein SDJN02_11798, partial [Cucurbita argyrosperma subsp. argyrosperma]